MLKNKSKLFVAVVTIVLLLSTICFATDEPVTTSAGDNAKTVEDTPVTTSEEEATSEVSQPEILSDDLYLFGDNIVMDQLVDGNVYLFGANIEVTGRVNGNLYAFGNNVTFKQGSYVVNSIYIAATEANLDTQCNDLYIVANKLNISYNTFIVRDLRVMSNDFSFNGCVGRNAFVTSDNFNFITEDQNSALIYGNLTYSSNSELNLSSDYIQGTINYIKPESISDEQSVQDVVLDKALDLVTSLVFTVIIYLLALWIAPKFMEKSSSFVSTKVIPSLGAGLIALILIPVISFILLISTIGISVAFALLGLYVLLLLICSSIVTICITNKIKEKFNLTKKYMVALDLILTSIVIWAIQQIPYAGGWIGFILVIIGLGIMFMYLFTRNKKNKETSETTDVVKE